MRLDAATVLRATLIAAVVNCTLAACGGPASSPLYGKWQQVVRVQPCVQPGLVWQIEFRPDATMTVHTIDPNRSTAYQLMAPSVFDKAARAAYKCNPEALSDVNTSPYKLDGDHISFVINGSPIIEYWKRSGDQLLLATSPDFQPDSTLRYKRSTVQ